MDESIGVGIIGCGNILSQYVRGCHTFGWLEIVGCADLDQDKAVKAAHEYDIPQAYPVEALLADPKVDIVLNLTVPNAHAEVNRAALAAGKHIYSEKPLSTERQTGFQTLVEASEKDLRVGCAPDTFMGGGLQTCRKLLDDGWIGQPIGATAFMMSRGPEGWHPNPDFFYQPGAGPLFDMAPYYLTALIQLLGPISRVAGSNRISFPERIATSKECYGQRIEVNVPTHSTALLNFTAGPIGVLITSFDVVASELPRIEVYGSEGTLSVPDPNYFGGVVRICRMGEETWEEIPLTHSSSVGRGIGLADMAKAILTGRDHRANGEVAYHVLDTMVAIGESSNQDRYIHLDSSCSRSAPLPLGLLPGQLDD